MSELQKDIEWYKENIKMMNISLSARSYDLQKLKKRIRGLHLVKRQARQYFAETKSNDRRPRY